MKKILITGADGFIGSHLTELLIEKKFKITALVYYNSLGNFGWLSNMNDKYKRKTKIYYRKLCDSCVRSSKKPTSYRSLGYVKKKECDHCGFESNHPEHFEIYYLDGNKANQRISNLKTVCLNCKVTIKNEGWRVTAGDLVPD